MESRQNYTGGQRQPSKELPAFASAIGALHPSANPQRQLTQATACVAMNVGRWVDSRVEAAAPRRVDQSSLPGVKVLLTSWRRDPFGNLQRQVVGECRYRQLMG
jgi:hypothetical protein